MYKQNNAKKIMAIVWAPEERRTFNISKILGASLHNVHFLLYKRPWVAPLKYPLQWLKTWYILVKNRPSLVYVTNPPIFAPLAVAMYCAVFRKTRFIMDTHSPALYSKKWGWTLPLQRFVAKFAALNSVDQDRFKDLFESWGAKAMVMRFPPPSDEFLSIARKTPVDSEFTITVVNTFAADEPVEPIIEAARQNPNVKIYILGDTALADPELLKSVPANVTFTGYIRKNLYWEQLGKSHAVVVLTTYAYSLLAGAQESMWVGKPVILSDQPALREFFTKGTIFVENTGASISQAIKDVQAREEALKQEISELAQHRSSEYYAALANLKNFIRDTLHVEVVFPQDDAQPVSIHSA
jgi:glycosyltransferase involved in cell wall biosynthesis